MWPIYHKIDLRQASCRHHPRQRSKLFRFFTSHRVASAAEASNLEYAVNWNVPPSQEDVSTKASTHLLLLHKIRFDIVYIGLSRYCLSDQSQETCAVVQTLQEPARRSGE